MKILRFFKHMDEAAYNVFEHMTALSKSMILGGLIGSVLVAACSVIAGIYILYSGYTIELGEIFDSLIDRSAALPAIAAFVCLVFELSSRNIK